MPKQTVKYEDIRKKAALNSSSNGVLRAFLNTSGAKDAGIAETHAVFIKPTTKLKAQEESTFSLLYQLDIGKQAAQTKMLTHKGNPMGIASIEVKGFHEYWKLSEGKSEYSSEIFNLDQYGKRQSIKKVEGLANLLMSAWLYAEDDFHRGNFGVACNEQGQLYWARLDFGLSFSNITNEQGRPFREIYHHFDKITLSDLESFPVLNKANFFYWPTSQTIYNYTMNYSGGIKHSVFSNEDKQAFIALKQNSVFQAEKNAFLLKQFLINTDLKVALIKDKIDEPRGSRLAATIEARILKMRWTALASHSFRSYIQKLRDDQVKIQTLLNEVCQTQSELMGLSEGNARSFCWAQLNDLLKLVELIETSQEKPTAQECMTSALLVVDSIEGDLGNLKTNQYSRDKVFANYLASSGEDDNKLEEKLADIHRAIDQNCVLKPLDDLLASEDLEDGLKEIFKHIRTNWIIPHLHNVAKDDEVDELFSRQSLKYIRNIEFLITDLISHHHINSSDDIFRNLKINSKSMLDVDSMLKELKDLERYLITQKYAGSFSKDYENLQNIVLPNADICLTKLPRILSHSIHVLLPQFIDTCYENTLSDQKEGVEESNFIGDVERIHAIYSEFLTQEFFNAMHENQLPKPIMDKFNKHFSRIHLLLARYGMNQDEEQIFQSMSQANQQSFIQELSFIMARMALDIQCENTHHQLLNNQSVSKLTESMKNLLQANEQLSLAMASPRYHDKESLSLVAQAGLLGARSLQNPTFENAQACFEHIEKLSNSHQIRLLTKIAFAVAIASVIILNLSLIALFGPLGLATTCASLLLLESLELTAVLAATTLVASSGYCLARFFRDKDKVERKLTGIAHTLPSDIPSALSDEADEAQNGADFNLK